jgi:fatty-acyl-CoA synthase
MMDTPLLISTIAEHAEKFHGDREIVSVTMDDPRHRYTMRESVKRARKLANALGRLGLDRGDRIATIAWNDYRHLEIYYAVSGAGHVCHTINPRLFPEQLIFIINHAEDRWIFTDLMFVPLLEKLLPHIPNVEGFVVLTDERNMPETSLPNAVCYETLLAAESEAYEWPQFDERTASALCYTSGTTGDPKGVLYDHRSTVLHAYASVAPDVLGLASTDVVLPVVPLFHVNAWGLPYSALMTGAKIVFPGPKMGDGEALFELIESENVTLAAGVPTVWMALLQYCRANDKIMKSLKKTVIGGAAVPRSMIEEFRDVHDVQAGQGWGMTETSPIGAVNTLKSGLEGLSDDEKLDLATKAGRGVYGSELRIVDDQGSELPWDGVAYGALQVRGPWVCSDYFKLEVAITDRTKDVIKSGGEWISSIELENTAMGHPGVAEAGVIGVAHPKWTERPLLVVVKAEGHDVSKDELLTFFKGKVADWWIPTDVAFVDELPHTATGKIKKIELREQFADYAFPE